MRITINKVKNGYIIVRTFSVLGEEETYVASSRYSLPELVKKLAGRIK